jgi:trimethylamine-N-oxide reductase (cytochrome c)
MFLPSLFAAYTGGTGGEADGPSIAKTLLPDAILQGHAEWWGCHDGMAPREDQFVRRTYPARGCSRIHMVWTDSPCFQTCWNDGNRFIRAMRHEDIQFICVQHPWLENDCLLADLILPVSSTLETDDIGADLYSGQHILVFPQHKCVEPAGETFSDYEIVCMVAERLGLLEEYTGGRTIPELIRHGFETSGAQELISWDELNERGYVIVPTDPDWETVRPGLLDLYEDPAAHPLSTPTGKIEFYATGLAEHFPGDEERPPVPHWIPEGPTHQETRGTERAKRYPLLVMSNHPRWSVHAQHQDISWLREIMTCKMRGPDGYQYQPLWIHPADAAARGIAHGDVVRVFNERGEVLAAAYVTERIIPGAVSMDHGAKADPIVIGEIDRGGNINAIVPGKTTSQNAVGMAVSGFLAEVEKVDLAALAAQYPDAFARPFDLAGGPGVKAWLTG